MDYNIIELLSSLGFTSDPTRQAARQLLETNKLTNPRKTFISEAKLPRVRELLTKHVLRLCKSGECAALAAKSSAERPIIAADSPGDCTICSGSSQRRAVRLLVSALHDAGIDRLLVVGGSPASHLEIRQALTGERVEVRLIDGSTRGHSEREGRTMLNWAQLVIIWSGTQMNHKASQVYTARCPVRQILVPRPGLESLCRTTIEAIQTPGRRSQYA